MKNDQTYLFLLFALLASCSGQKADAPDESKSNQPNIVLLISDDQSWTDYGFMGHPTIETPYLDQLAEESLTFTYGYAAAPLCSPSLASIITGLYPHQHGVLGNDPIFASEEERYSAAWRSDRLEHYQKYLTSFEQINTLADLLGKEGYTSLQTGKWWLGNYASGGFDQGMTHGDPARGGRHGDDGLDIGREGLQEIYSFMDSARSAEKPFFVWYAPFLPHAPHTPPDSLLQKYRVKAPTEAVARYWAMCEWFDITCGQLVNYVDNKGMKENTLFVYVTDNGWIQDPDKPNRYAPRSKREPYEMGIRTPMMFRWAGTIEPEMDSTHPVSAIDIATTVLAINEIEPTDYMQGINVLDKEALNTREVIFAENFAHDFTTIDSSLYHRIAIDLPYKLILPDANNQPEDEIELFNIVEDPHEMQNLAKGNLEKVAELTGKIEVWWQD